MPNSCHMNYITVLPQQPWMMGQVVLLGSLSHEDKDSKVQDLARSDVANKLEPGFKPRGSDL